jgi:hypothetical protein
LGIKPVGKILAIVQTLQKCSFLEISFHFSLAKQRKR